MRATVIFKLKMAIRSPYLFGYNITTAMQNPWRSPFSLITLEKRSCGCEALAEVREARGTNTVHRHMKAMKASGGAG